MKGEVVNPGVYRIRIRETLPELIERVGGFTPDAYVYASIFTRESVRQEQLRRMEESIARMQKELAQATARLQARTLDASVKSSAAGQMEAKTKSIEVMRKTVATGRIVLRLQREATLPKSLPAMELQDGDTFLVPSKMNEIHVMGEVYNQQSSIWNARDTVLETMASAGGPTKHADMKELFLIRADGTVVSFAQQGKKFIRLPIYPGDTLVVPEQLDFANWKYELKEWVKIFSDFAIGAAAIRVLSSD